MPPELLSRIFELGVHERLSLLPTLSLVCRLWRNITLTTPSLWSHIRLDHGHTTTLLRKLTAHIERSQACKLQVDIDFCLDDFRFLEAFPDVLMVMTQLEPHLDRCFSFRVCVPDWDWMSTVRERSYKLGPCLEELYLRIDRSDAEDQPPMTFLQAPFPRLHTIVLEHIPLTCIRPASPTTPLVLPSLRKLHLIGDRDRRYRSSPRIGISFKELLHTISCTPSLVELRIQHALFHLDCTEPIFHRNPTLTTIPLLSSLSFHYIDTTNASLLLDSLSLPSLHRLSIQMDSQNEETTYWLSRLSTPCFPNLRHLDLCACNIDGLALFPFIRALHALPSLTTLGLSSPRSGILGWKLFDLLSLPSPSSPSPYPAPPIPTTSSTTDLPLSSAPPPQSQQAGVWILPNLRALCVQHCHDISGHELLRLVRARCNNPGGVEVLRYLRISRCDSVDQEAVDLLKGLVDVVVIA